MKQKSRFLAFPAVFALVAVLTLSVCANSRPSRPLNPNFDLYPDSSLADFSHLLKAPAGCDGFVTTGPDGHFHFGTNGPRARFWGVTITQEHIDIPKHRIDEVVDVLARAGCNMVRFHSLDNRAGLQYGFLRRTIIDETPPHDNDTQHFDAEYLDRLDYWIAKLKERGIYSYIVLRGFRHYLPGDDVTSATALPRGATPMAFFNERLIELQVQFARQLLVEHVNPYTKLSFANDPAVALIEVFNEDSLFSRPALWHSMPAPYQAEFQGLWADYLKRTYGTTKKLRAEWTNTNGVCALQTSETLELGNIALPDMNATESFEVAQSAPYDNPQRSPVRRREGVRFAIEIQRQYFKRMMAALHDMGVRVPCTGVVAGKSIPDTFSAAQEFDFTAENMYEEHPSYEPGRDWLPPAYYQDKNYLTSVDPGAGVPFIARYKWQGKPLAVREWATCWPNQYRASSILEMATYGRLQDWDCMLYFAYYTTGDFTRLGSFVLNNDPARWSLFGPAAQVFLGSNSIGPARKSVGIVYGPEDMGAYSSWEDLLHTLSWNARVENVYLDPKGAAVLQNLLVLTGRSGDGLVAGKLIVGHNRSEWVDARQKKRVAARMPQEGDRGTSATLASVMDYVRSRIAQEDEPTSPVFGCKSVDGSIVLRDAGAGQLAVLSPNFVLFQGVMPTGTKAAPFGDVLSAVSQSPFAVIMALSLDDQPLTASKRYLVKMVTVAENRKQLLEPSRNPKMPDLKVLTSEGGTPIVTKGQYTRDGKATQVSLFGRQLISVGMENGTWELLVDEAARTADLYCDLPNVEFMLNLADAYEMTAHPNESAPLPGVPVGKTFKYPGWAKFARLKY
ncbi:MAG: hypothetical protein K1X53_03075 [Candidatus Sumerlaeaceae bacterium]|nr:hypothetical protein [Candidatus Sumerlaeaceae bacterium]